MCGLFSRVRGKRKKKGKAAKFTPWCSGCNLPMIAVNELEWECPVCSKRISK